MAQNRHTVFKDLKRSDGSAAQSQSRAALCARAVAQGAQRCQPSTHPLSQDSSDVLWGVH